MIYIVTEFASKGDIFDHLVKNGKMSEPEACHIFSQILSAVKYCPSHGVNTSERIWEKCDRLTVWTFSHFLLNDQICLL